MNKIGMTFVEIDGSDEIVRSVISQLMAQVRESPRPSLATDSAPQVPLPHSSSFAMRRRSLATTARKRRPATSEPDVLTQRILAALAKRGMSSGELIASLRAKAADRLDMLRKNGQVETSMDESDATRKNYLKQPPPEK